MGAPKLLLATCIYPDVHERHRGTFIHQRAKQLRNLGFDLEVFKRDHITFGTYLSSFRRIYNFYTTPRVSRYSWEGITVHRQGIHLRMPLNYSKAAPRLTYEAIKPRILGIHEDFPFDLMYLATWGDLSLAMSWIARDMKIPYIAGAIGAHDNEYYDKPSSIYYKCHREIYQNSQMVVCVSEDLNRKVRIMTDGLAKTCTFYSGVDTSLFARNPRLRSEYRRRLGYSGDDKVVLQASRLEKTKGVYELIEAFAQIAASDPSLRLLLVGDLSEEIRLKRAIRSRGIQSKVAMTGGVDHGEIPGYMNAADVFVLPSWMEGLPNVVMEACACELPVVACAVGGVLELIEDGVTGLLAPARSPGQLAARIRQLATSPAEAARIGKAARSKMVREFNYETNGASLAGEIADIINRCRAVQTG